MNLNEARRLAGLQEVSEAVDKEDNPNSKKSKLIKKYEGKTATAEMIRDIYSSGYSDGYNDSPKK